MIYKIDVLETVIRTITIECDGEGSAREIALSGEFDLTDTDQEVVESRIINVEIVG